VSRIGNTLKCAALVAAIVPIALGCAKKEDAPARPTASRTAPTQTVAAPSGGTASIGGSVNFTGTAPAMGPIDMAADPVCTKLHTSAVPYQEAVVNENGTLANVIVYVKSGLTGSYEAPAEASVLDQAGCQYTPHVSAVQAGQTLRILNSDATLHNVLASPSVNAGFNKAMPVKGMKIDHTFEDAEPTPVRLKCQVHPWMTAYIGVFDHPFFSVTGDDGSFSIKNLPAGTYTIAAWHEKYPEQTAEIQVADGQAATAEFSFGS